MFQEEEKDQGFAQAISALMPIVFDLFAPPIEEPDLPESMTEEEKDAAFEAYEKARGHRENLRGMLSQVGPLIGGVANRPSETDRALHLYRSLVESQLESMDVLRGALGIMGAALREGSGSGSGGSSQTTPPGYLLLKEEVYAEQLQAMEVVKAESEEMFSALQKASSLLGFDGDIDEGFLRYLEKCPGPDDAPYRYRLPDGGKTNVLADAYAAWASDGSAGGD